MGQAPDGAAYNDSGDGWLLIAGAGDFGEGVPAPKKFTSQASKLSRPGDIILGIRASIGEMVLSDGIYCLGRGVAGLRAGSRLESRYLWHWLGHSRPVLALKAKGATFKQVNRSDIGELEVLLPPIPEQRRIAGILDLSEALRAKRRAALDQVNTLTQAVFFHLFGDATSILTRWTTKELGAVLEFLTSGSRGWAIHYADSGDLFLRIQNVRYDELALDDVAFVRPPDTAEAKRTRVQSGDVLLSITADLGRTAVVPDGLGPAFISQHLSILRTSAFAPRFLSAYLASPAGQRQVSGRNRQAVKAGLNFDDIRAIVVPMPPLPLQHEFARRVAAVDRLKAQGRSARLPRPPRRPLRLPPAPRLPRGAMR